MTASPRSAPVILAREGAFALGPLRIDPSLRAVLGAGCSETLEPRVMQVLVVLARAGGTIVTRDELTMSCWGGRVVGEDAINRTLGRLRRLARQTDAFQLETIRKVGYRLVVLPPAEPAAPFAPDVAAYALPPAVGPLDRIAGAYLSMPRPDAHIPVAVRAQRRRADLKHAALIAGFALAATQFAQAPQYIASGTPAPAPAMATASNLPEHLSGGSLKLASLIRYLDELRARSGGQSAPAMLPPMHRPGLSSSAPGETPAFRPYAPPLHSRAPDYTINWLSPSALTLHTVVTVQLDEI